jgi:hypothetical protein
MLSLLGGENMELSGEYIVMFKHPSCPKDITDFQTFKGKCENFITTGLCAFSNENNQMLLVNYKDILQMKPIKDMFNK